jgi:hypothetical protein
LRRATGRAIVGRAFGHRQRLRRGILHAAGARPAATRSGARRATTRAALRLRLGALGRGERLVGRAAAREAERLRQLGQARDRRPSPASIRYMRSSASLVKRLVGNALRERVVARAAESNWPA